MKTKSNLFTLFFAIFVTLVSCQRNSSKISDETPTRGNINIVVDESYSLLFNSQLYAFSSYYKDAHINIAYKPETDALKLFLNDSVRLMVTSRQLTKIENDFLNSKQIIARTTKIAYDAIALIINPNNPDSLLTYKMAMQIFKGNTPNWTDIYPKSKLGKLKIAFDNNQSGNVRYFVEKFNIKNMPNYCYAVDNNNEVINFVQKNKNALGIISVNWISDRHDTVSNTFLNKIKVVAITPEFDPEGNEYCKPYQAYIADKSYPFIREVYMINRESFTGLGSGFIQFVAGEKGQRIILKSKLVPATMPVRLVQIRSN